jgi:hypothetical protein
MERCSSAGRCKTDQSRNGKTLFLRQGTGRGTPLHDRDGSFCAGTERQILSTSVRWRCVRCERDDDPHRLLTYEISRGLVAAIVGEGSNNENAPATESSMTAVNKPSHILLHVP